MDYNQFSEAAARRAGMPVTDATAITRATLETLAERISGGEAEDLAAQLPKELRDYLRKQREFAEPFGLAEFVRRVSSRAGVDVASASDSVPAVLATVREAVTAGEFEDVVSQLPKEFWEMLERAGTRVEIPRGRR